MGEGATQAQAMAFRMDPLLAPPRTGGAGHVRELMLAVGRPADGMIVSSRLLLARLRAGDRK